MVCVISSRARPLPRSGEAAVRKLVRVAILVGAGAALATSAYDGPGRLSAEAIGQAYRNYAGRLGPAVAAATETYREEVSRIRATALDKAAVAARERASVAEAATFARRVYGAASAQLTLAYTAGRDAYIAAVQRQQEAAQLAAREAESFRQAVDSLGSASATAAAGLVLVYRAGADSYRAWVRQATAMREATARESESVRSVAIFLDRAYRGGKHRVREITAAMGTAYAALPRIPAPEAAAPPGKTGNPVLDPLIGEAANRFGIPERWIRAVMHVESGGEISATSPKGAMGLMQVMPETYAALRWRYGLGDNPYATRDNVLAGSAYIREMYDRFGAPGFIAAYNAGPARYDDFLQRGRGLPYETLRYIASVTNALGEKFDDKVFGKLPAVRPFALPHFREPIGVSANGEMLGLHSGQPVTLGDRLALHGLLSHALGLSGR